MQSILNRLGVTQQCDKQTDRRTDILVEQMQRFTMLRGQKAYSIFISNVYMQQRTMGAGITRQ